MKSIFHVPCSTPEDLRQEFITWLQARAATEEDYAQNTARTKRDQLVHFSKARAYREVMQFWQEIIIDEKSQNKNQEVSVLNSPQAEFLKEPKDPGFYSFPSEPPEVTLTNEPQLDLLQNRYATKKS